VHVRVGEKESVKNKDSMKKKKFKLSVAEKGHRSIL
jgi:hypothetical protein